ncbi:MAG TPA: hypothetical protein DCM08_08955 [Microscillaceae bacterium]|nr:hypothetical protein [Microscillaceae bacterium]
MYKSLFYFIALLVFSLASASTTQAQDVKTLLCKTWKYDMPQLKEIMAAKFAELPEDKRKEQESTMAMFMPMLEVLRMEFKADGTLNTMAMGQTQVGVWAIEADGKTIKTVGKDPSGQEKTTLLTIVKISPESLMLASPEKPSDPAQPFIPAD